MRGSVGRGVTRSRQFWRRAAASPAPVAVAALALAGLPLGASACQAQSSPAVAPAGPPPRRYDSRCAVQRGRVENEDSANSAPRLGMARPGKKMRPLHSGTPKRSAPLASPRRSGPGPGKPNLRGDLSRTGDRPPRRRQIGQREPSSKATEAPARAADVLPRRGAARRRQRRLTRQPSRYFSVPAFVGCRSRSVSDAPAARTATEALTIAAVVGAKRRIGETKHHRLLLRSPTGRNGFRLTARHRARSAPSEVVPWAPVESEWLTPFVHCHHWTSADDGSHRPDPARTPRAI